MRFLFAFLLLLLGTAAVQAQASGCYDTLGSPLLNGTEDFENSAASCTTPGGSDGGDSVSTQAFVGVSVPLGEAFNPHFVAGVRVIQVKGGVAIGAEANATISMVKWLEDTQIHLLGVGGWSGSNFDVLLNAGVGYDVGTQGFLFTGGAQIQYARIYADWTMADPHLRPFIELNSLVKLVAGGNGTACGNEFAELLTPEQILEKFASDYYGPTSAYQGDIYSGGVIDGNLFQEHFFSGTQSSTAFVDGQTCFNLPQTT